MRVIQIKLEDMFNFQTLKNYAAKILNFLTELKLITVIACTVDHVSNPNNQRVRARALPHACNALLGSRLRDRTHFAISPVILK